MTKSSTNSKLSATFRFDGHDLPFSVIEDFAWNTVSQKALEGNKRVWACWEVETTQYVGPDCFVFIDESHIDPTLIQPELPDR